MSIVDDDLYVWNRDHRSEVTNAILGLNLLYLLVENRLSDFHCEVLYGLRL